MPKANFISEIARGLAVVSMIGGYIVGPLLLCAGIGYAIDYYFHTGRVAFFISLGVAFIISNVVIVKKSSYISKYLVKNGN